MPNIKHLAENPHPIYVRNHAFWRFLLNSYEGGIDYNGAMVDEKSNDVNGIEVRVNGEALRSTADTNLFRHARERNDSYLERVDMSYYYNFCAPVIDVYTNHLFRHGVVGDFGSIDKLVEAKAKDIDRKQGSIEEVRRELAEVSQIYGHSFVVVDSPMVDKEIFSLQDQIDNDVFPYLSVWHPQNIINWSLDAFGRPYFVLTKETVDTMTDPMANADKKNRFQNRYRLWTRDEWFVFGHDYEQTATGRHGLGIVPIVCAFDKQSKKAENFLGVSFIADIAFIARDIYNVSSELRQILRDQTFSILALQGDASDYPLVEVGTSKGLVIPRDVQMPQYIAPPPAPAETLMKHIDNQVSKIFQIAKLEGGSASFKGQSAIDQSGASKAWDFNQTNSALAMKAGNMEDAEMKIWNIWAKWQGKEFDGSVVYPRDFSVQSLKQDLDEAEQTMKMNISNEFNKEIKKAIVRKKFPRLQKEDLDKIDSEIEAGQTTGNSLINRLPGLFNKNADSSGNGGI